MQFTSFLWQINASELIYTCKLSIDAPESLTSVRSPYISQERKTYTLPFGIVSFSC